MEQALQWLAMLAPDTWYGYFGYLLAGIGAASLAAKTIAPLTKTTIDDKLAGLLSKAKAFLDALALNPKVQEKIAKSKKK